MEYIHYKNLLKWEFNNLMVEAQRRYGEISPYYLEKSMEVVQAAITQFGRVFALRVDLRFAEEPSHDYYDMPTCFQRCDPKAITRFMEALKSRIKAEHNRKGRTGAPAFPLYIWVRERAGSNCCHYHLVLFFNRDVYRYLGDYRNPDGINMATRVQQSWCSAVGLVYPDYAPLVHFPHNGSYYFDQRTMNLNTGSFNGFLLRLAYFCKTNSKDIGDGQRNFGCSQI
ncbi:inovirus Gp2 family protein [Aeromonas allosaccharophila]|uniref:inovirus Gp2 family protein n=1 Tax=Aeromonas allosaccharophila TaxID=656 RepID=UPI002AE09716|nr:inovirus Gp2 family protein [Aeromonas allosaccharophila]